MTLSRIGLAASALLLAVVLGAPCALAHSGGGHGHGHSVSVHVPPGEDSGHYGSKHSRPGGVSTRRNPPAHTGPPPYTLDEDGHLVSHGFDEGDGGARGGGERSSSGGREGSD